VPPHIKQHSLTAGILQGPGRMITPPLVFVRSDAQEMESYLHLGRSVCGHDGIVHGGLLATILDEAMGHVVRGPHFTRVFFLPNNVLSRAATSGHYESRNPRRSYRKSDHKLSRAHAGRPVYRNQGVARTRQRPKGRGRGANRRPRWAPPCRGKVRWTHISRTQTHRFIFVPQLSFHPTQIRTFATGPCNEQGLGCSG